MTIDYYKNYIQDKFISRLEQLMGNAEVPQVNLWAKYGSCVTKDEAYRQALHEIMLPYYSRYLNGDTRLCCEGQHLEHIARVMNEAIADDDLFGAWVSGQNLITSAECWGDNLKRYEKEQRRIYRFFHVLEALFEVGCRQDWQQLGDELKEMLFKAEMCYDYKTDEVLCVLHGFVMIMRQEWSCQKKREQLALLRDNWLFLKHYYSVMTRHIIGVRWTSFRKVAETVMSASQSFKPHLHIFYCGLMDCVDELHLKKDSQRRMDKVIMLMQEELNRCEPSDMLYELCDALFSEDFQRLLREHRAKSYKEVEDESRMKDELIRQMQEQTKHLKGELDKTAEMLRHMLENAIPIEQIDVELEQYPPATAWDLLQKLNESPVLMSIDAYRNNYRTLLEKYRKRLWEPIRRQEEMADTLKRGVQDGVTMVNATNYMPQIQTQNVPFSMPPTGGMGQRQIEER